MERLLWIDLEMTGLDVSKEVIIEAAAVITNLRFDTIDTYHAVLKQPQSYLDSMDDWNKTHHKNSGLLGLVPTGKEPEQVEKDFLGILDRHFANERAVIAGNSIAQDRLFIDKYFKTFASRLHYRMLDVTSWKLIMKELYKKEYKKRNAHRAVDDIHESINELKFYLSFIDPKAGL